MMMRMCVAVLRGSAVLAWVLGVLFWRGNADNFVPLHLAIALGVLMALSLWGAGLLVGTKGGSPQLMISAFVVGLIGMVFAFNQETFLAGSLHWIIQVVHVLLAMSMVILAIPIARHYNAAQASQLASRSILQRQDRQQMKEDIPRGQARDNFIA
jgi:hypothetical protein